MAWYVKYLFMRFDIENRIGSYVLCSLTHLKLHSPSLRLLFCCGGDGFSSSLVEKMEKI